MQSPNYITEINMFYDWLETNQIPKSAIALWHGLMHIANKAGWEQSFTVAISTIESKTGFKRSELFEARNILTQKNRISWKYSGIITTAMLVGGLSSSGSSSYKLITQEIQKALNSKK